MNKKPYFVCLLVSLLIAGLRDTGFAQSSLNRVVPGEVIVKAKGELLPGQLEGYGITGAEQICRDKQGRSSIYLLSFKETVQVHEMIGRLMQSNAFDWAEPNGYMQACVLPNDSMFMRQYGEHNLGNFNLTFSTLDSDADLPEAWNLEQGDSNVVVAVLDGGLALAHPEFAGRVWKNYNEIAANNTDDDGNGYKDDVQGWNFAYGNNNPADDLGHGTSVTGVLGAQGNNTKGLAGIDWNCKLMICKVLDSTNGGSYANIANAIYYAVNNGADVLNMSFSGNYSSVISVAVQYAWNNNAVMCAATGNNNSSTPQYPSAYPDVLAVGGSNAWDVRYIWSNYGPHMDVVAAGDYIYELDYANFNNYANYSSGTSLASPLVAGIASLLKAQKPSRTNQQIYDIIRLTAEDQVDQYTNEDSPGWDIYFGYGRVNAFQALLYDSIQSGLHSLTGSSRLRIFPNPSSGIFSLRCETEITSIVIVNTLGEVVYSSSPATAPGAITEIPLSGQPGGLYFYQLSTGEDIFKGRLIIQ